MNGVLPPSRRPHADDEGWGMRFCILYILDFVLVSLLFCWLLVVGGVAIIVVCMYVCMYVGMYVGMYGWMYANQAQSSDTLCKKKKKKKKETYKQKKPTILKMKKKI